MLVRILSENLRRFSGKENHCSKDHLERTRIGDPHSSPRRRKEETDVDSPETDSSRGGPKHRVNTTKGPRLSFLPNQPCRVRPKRKLLVTRGNVNYSIGKRGRTVGIEKEEVPGKRNLGGLPKILHNKLSGERCALEFPLIGPSHGGKA